MLPPKPGFVKIALKTGAPIIPIAMRGTYDILPPHRKIPSLKRCDVVVGEPMFLNKKNPLLRDIFLRAKDEIGEDDEKEIAYRVMQKVREMSGQEWQEDAMPESSLSLIA